MARQVLSGSKDDSADLSSSRASAHQVMVHVDVSALNGDGGESDYPLTTVKRLCCAGEVLPIFKSGETKLENLLLLVTHHHTLMHEGGFQLKPANGRFYFAQPDGRPIEPAPPSSAEDEGGDEKQVI
jgi:hypothetical protein|tara:strand:- start:177 stop:557 length:381 start_codon:yes stop_codon:yes gene_type:complete